MELSDLISYAEEKYGLREAYLWPDDTCRSAFRDPATGKVFALLIHRADPYGTEPEACDLCCGRALLSASVPYITVPFFIRGADWVGIRFYEETDEKTVLELFDRAASRFVPPVFILQQKSADPGSYRDTPLPFSGFPRASSQEMIPQQIRQMYMLKSSLSPWGSVRDRRRQLFYLQAKFMKDYEDDAPYNHVPLSADFPTYENLNGRQLRGYFTWRTLIRRDICRNGCPAFVYIYYAELLNGIGAVPGEEVLRKLEAFEKLYFSSPGALTEMEESFRKWKYEYSIAVFLPRETAARYMSPQMQEFDHHIHVLRSPEKFSEDEIFRALSCFQKLVPRSPSMPEHPGFPFLLAHVWRHFSPLKLHGDKDFFTECFGEMRTAAWHPLEDTAFYSRFDRENGICSINAVRQYCLTQGKWSVSDYSREYFRHSEALSRFLHAAILLLSRDLHIRCSLRPSPLEAYLAPPLEAALQEAHRAKLQSERPRIVLSHLDAIRRDAGKTRDSLLTEADLEDDAPVLPAETAPAETAPEEAAPAEAAPAETIPGLSAFHIRVLRSLLAGKAVGDDLLREHMLPSVVADTINEALWDEIGDSVLNCESDRLSLVEDYREDLESILGTAP